MQTDYSQIISEYFNKIFMYRDNVLPKLKELIKVHETFNERFHVKKMTLYALKIFSFVFMFGVVTPMLLINLKQDYNIVWLSGLPYFLLFITTLPYMFVCWKLYLKVGSLNFK